MRDPYQKGKIMPDQPVIKGETVEPTDQPSETPESPKPGFPTKTFVKYALATSVAAILGGYAVKKLSASSDDEDGDGWTVVPVDTTPSDQTN